MNEPILLNVLVNKIPIDFEFDSGVSISVIPENIYKKNCLRSVIIPINEKLKIYYGSIFQPVGQNTC